MQMLTEEDKRFYSTLNIRIGDRVVFSTLAGGNITDYSPVGLLGLEGVVREKHTLVGSCQDSPDRYMFAVEFDKDTVKFHDCHGIIPSERGYYVDYRGLKTVGAGNKDINLDAINSI